MRKRLFDSSCLPVKVVYKRYLIKPLASFLPLADCALLYNNNNNNINMNKKRNINMNSNGKTNNRFVCHTMAAEG